MTEAYEAAMLSMAHLNRNGARLMHKFGRFCDATVHVAVHVCDLHVSYLGLCSSCSLAHFLLRYKFSSVFRNTLLTPVCN